MKKKFMYFISGSILVSILFSVLSFGEKIFDFNNSNDLSYNVSDWAEKEVKKAIEYGLVPKELQGNYTKNITREEFCKLCVAVMKAWNNNFQYKKGNINFSDTDSKEILICAERGIVKGIGNSRFAPESPVKRQEAAKMLYNTLNKETDVISELHKKAPADGVSECCVPHSFDDGGIIRSWARNEISHMYRYGVMLGDSHNNYNPNEYYTREQAIISFFRLFKCKNSMKENPIPESDCYPYDNSAWDYDSDGVANIISYPEIKDEYTMNYIDSNRKKYTHKEKGYVYPFDRKYAEIVISIGAGVGRSVVINQKGDICLQNINKDLYGLYDVDIMGKYASVIHAGEGDIGVYDIETGQKAFEEIYDMKEGLYACCDDDVMGVVDKNGNMIFKLEYPLIYTGCHNSEFILKNKDGSYSIAKSDGKINKTFTVNKDWIFVASIGSNAIFAKTINSDDCVFYFYNAYSEKYNKFNYTDLKLLDGYDFVVIDENERHILNYDGSIKFSIKNSEYDNISCISQGLYKVYRHNDTDDYIITDIVRKNGNIIKKDINDYGLLVDKSGICSYEEDNKILFFDFFGDDIGSFDINDEVYYNPNTKEKENIIEININRKFFNGLLWINAETDKGNLCSKYILPDGRSFTKWE